MVAEVADVVAKLSDRDEGRLQHGHLRALLVVRLLQVIDRQEIRNDIPLATRERPGLLPEYE